MHQSLHLPMASFNPALSGVVLMVGDCDCHYMPDFHLICLVSSCSVRIIIKQFNDLPDAISRPWYYNTVFAIHASGTDGVMMCREYCKSPTSSQIWDVCSKQCETSLAEAQCSRHPLIIRPSLSIIATIMLHADAASRRRHALS